MKHIFDQFEKSPFIKKRIANYSYTLFTLILLACMGIQSVKSQDNKALNLQEKKLPPFTCKAPIDASWRSISAKKESIQPMVRVAYLIPSNRSQQNRGVEALQKIITTGSNFLRDEMMHNGLAPKTFRYETEADDKTPLIHVINIPETDVQIEGENQFDAWNNKINAAMNAGLGVWQRGQVWLLVSESHLQQPDGSIKAGGALGASFGNADDPGVATIPSNVLSLIGRDGLTDDRDYHGLIFPEIGPYPLQQDVSFAWFDGRTVSSITSVMIGASWHELMHALGIGPHDFRNDDNFHGNIMGNGFRGIRGYLYRNRYTEDYTRLAFATAHALNNNHYLNEVKERNGIDGLFFSPLSTVPQNGKLVFNVTSLDADGLALLRLIGPSAFHTEKLLSGVDFDGQIETPYFEPGIESNFIIQVYDKQGNKAESNFHLTPQVGSHRSPVPFMRFTPPIGEFGDSFVLDAKRSFDSDGDFFLTAEWDLDNDGAFDTPLNQNRTYLAENLPAGNHLVRVRITNSSGMQTISTPMALHVSGEELPQSEITFTLINADTNQVIPEFDPIPEGAELNLAFLPSQMSIRANVPSNYESVRFEYDGSMLRVENISPYALFGDIEGVYNSGSFSLGSHSVTATPFTLDDANGQVGASKTIQFSVVKSPITFTLIDADTNQVIPEFDPIPEGAELNLAFLPSQLSMRANVPLNYESVRFEYDGSILRVENISPYALFGDIEGVYNSGSFSLGSHSVTATPFTLDDANGQVGASKTIQFSVVKSPITFTLIDADTNQVIPEFDPIPEGAELDLTFLPLQLSIRANVPSNYESVRFEYDGSMLRVENVSPYALFGDVEGVYNSGSFSLGSHSVTATPFTLDDALGEAGTPKIIQFSVVNNKLLPLPQISHKNFPNPFNHVTNIVFDLPTATNVRLLVRDFLGREVAILVDEWKEAGRHLIRFDAGNSLEGIYYYQLKTANGDFAGKLLLIK